ncbi:hypothetical protein FACS189413_05530 [Bacteroidia bacterium]|nr:hypothetical protein FACS189413_05530 [Bacteroidia bacterium]
MYKIGDNIISSLGFTTEENFANVKRGVSGVKHYDAGTFDLPEAFMASLIDRERLNDEFYRHCGLDSQSPNYTDFEKAAILSVSTANQEVKIDLSNENVLFILSSTKGNVDWLGNVVGALRATPLHAPFLPLYLWHTATLITSFFGNKNTPLVVSNACISGAAAQIAAMRELENGYYDYAVVVGVDFLSKFIISGFQSFKALSPEICRPFDKDRCGLNLGEAAATIIFSCVETEHAPSLQCGAIRNDANHISGPSRTGEGSFRALKSILSTIENRTPEIAFINAHGTATSYNDAMEAVAITRSGLENVPVNSLKPYFGHTLGAAGVLESIISLKALQNNIILPTLNFNSQDIENQINISKEIQKTDKRYFIKMLSGFGGCNAALLFSYKNENPYHSRQETSRQETLYIKKQCSLKFYNSTEITEFYRSLQVDYPKFFKMDNLSKLGFLASEMIFSGDSCFRKNDGAGREDIAVICFNRSSSLEIDTKYQETIQDNENYFPSPSLFVYTLPNIITGEIAIRNKFFGETSFYVAEKSDAEQIYRTVKNSFSDKNTNFALVAWAESFKNTFEIKMFLITKEKTDDLFDVNCLNFNCL